MKVHAKREFDINDASQLASKLVEFSRLLGHAGIHTSPSSTRDLARALAVIKVSCRDEFRAAARSVLLCRHDQQEVFDRLFAAFFTQPVTQRINLGRSVRRIAEQRAGAIEHQGTPDNIPALEDDPLETLLIEQQVAHSERERLQRKDFARLTDEERRQVLCLLQEQPLRLRPRRSRRWSGQRRGAHVDLRRTLHRSLSSGGEIIDLERRRRVLKPRPVVVLCDLSGSMEAYARIILPFVYTLREATTRLEAFIFATRLTRVTHQLTHRSLDRALSESAAAISDWGGGTRIGESFRTFNRHWNRRVLGGGSVVLVVSDAWDRGDPKMLGRETARLSRSCHRLIWLNPLVGSKDYEPIASGARAVLPHVDDFLPCHDLQSLDQLRKILSEGLS